MSSVKLYQQVANAVSPQLRHLAEPPAEAAAEAQAPQPAEAALAQAPQAEAPPAPMPPEQTLKRTGERPYVFNGRLMAMLSGHTNHLPFWYEINVYQSVADEFVSELKLFNKDPNAADMFRVTEHEDMESLFDYLEQYDPSADLDPGRSVSEPTASSASLALNAARLQLRVNQLSRHYQGVVGEMLEGLHRQHG